VILNKLNHFVLYCLVFFPSISLAGDFDGSKLLVGSVEKVFEINQYKVRDDVDPDIVGLPCRFFIDMGSYLTSYRSLLAYRNTLSI